MYLFNDHEHGLDKKILSPMSGPAILAADKKLSLFERLTGEEKPDPVAGLLLVLVLLLHILGAQWLLQPTEAITLAQPLMMEVSMVNAPSPQPIAAPPAPPKPPEPKKSPVKKPVKQKAQVIPKQVTLPKPMKVSDAALPAPSPFESVTDNSKNTSDDTATGKSASKAETYSEASFKANYGINPKPIYPPLARSRGWEGKVLLRVNVSADGHADSVAIYHSSEHEVLDDAAVEAVEKWLFIPAKQGDRAVPCTVIVPINFTLNTQ
jgi:protein TonB